MFAGIVAFFLPILLSGMRSQALFSRGGIVFNLRISDALYPL